MEIKERVKPKKYPEEQIGFLQQQFTNSPITREKLTKKFNEKFNENVGRVTLGFGLTDHKILKEKKYKKVFLLYYTEEKLDFLRKNYEHTNTTREELTQMFNEKFGASKKTSAIMHALKTYKIKKDKVHYKASMMYSNTKYTKEHVDFIRKNYTENIDVGKREILKLFNENFEMDISKFQLGYIINKYELSRGRAGAGVIYTREVKQFMRKCVEKGMTKQECKAACEKEFVRYFNRNSMSQVAQKMGLSFIIKSQIKIDEFFEEHKEIEELIKKVLSKNPESKHQDILIRDAIIEKYQKNLKNMDIRTFCEIKNIKINCLGSSLEEKREYQKDRNKKKIAERLNSEWDEENVY